MPTDDLKIRDWIPQEPWQGPPLPEFLNIYWPWYTPPAAEFEVSDLLIAPSEVNPGQVVAISVKVTNIGTEAGDYTVKLAGDFTGEETVTLEAGASRRISFEVVPDVAKTYHVSVDSLTGTFRATEAPVEIVEFELPRPTVTPAEVTPGTAITITCPITSACTNPQTVTAKVIIYEGSILPGHGSVIATKTSPSFSIAPGQTYNVDVHHTAVAGTIDRRDIEVEVYIAGKLVKESEWDDVYYVEKPALPEVIMDLPLITIIDAESIPFADFRYAQRIFTVAPSVAWVPSYGYTFSSLADLAARHEHVIPFLELWYSKCYEELTECGALANLEKAVTWDGFTEMCGSVTGDLSYPIPIRGGCREEWFGLLTKAAHTHIATVTLSEPVVMEELKGIILHGISAVEPLKYAGRTFPLQAFGNCQYVSKEEYPHYWPGGPPVYYPITSTVRAIGGKRQPDGTMNIACGAPVFHVAYYPGIYHLGFRMLLAIEQPTWPGHYWGIADLIGQINDAVELRIGGVHP